MKGQHSISVYVWNEKVRESCGVVVRSRCRVRRVMGAMEPLERAHCARRIGRSDIHSIELKGLRSSCVTPRASELISVALRERRCEAEKECESPVDFGLESRIEWISGLTLIVYPLMREEEVLQRERSSHNDCVCIALNRSSRLREMKWLCDVVKV
ncbi:hypothetical protein Tco_0551757 [Tanacetum coccineum]